MSKLDTVAPRFRCHRLIKKLQGFDPPGKPVQVDFITSALAACFEANESGDKLQIVSDPVLYFLQHHILVADLSRKFLPLGTLTRSNIDKRDNTISFRSILILDDTGIRFHKGQPRFCPLEGPEVVIAFPNQFGKRVMW